MNTEYLEYSHLSDRKLYATLDSKEGKQKPVMSDNKFNAGLK